jgi:amino acid transporter
VQLFHISTSKATNHIGQQVEWFFCPFFDNLTAIKNYVLPGEVNHRNKGFGTFGGVFVPNILTILGVIMYLRTGWVVGNAGLKGTLIIVLIANLITFLTALSISSISTNMEVKGGGVYYIISRSLGFEAGGCVGIPLYLAQALGIGLYLAGFTEAVRNLFPDLEAHVIGLLTLIVLTILALISAKIVIKIQYIILVVIGLSIVAFFTGTAPDAGNIAITSNYESGHNFWSVFAVFFPAVTGILSGVSMSGDLKNPAKSIPRGTLLSVLVGSIIYFAISVWFSLTAAPEQLISNNSIMIDLAIWEPLIYAGIWGATLSSALASLLAAPRTMQALASDGIIFRFLGKGRGERNEPIAATVFTFLLVGIIVYLGDLNTIAPVLTMFFLITYGSVNFIAFIESLLQRPGFRPSFKVNWIFSFVGALACIWVMFIINVLACVIGFGFVALLYFVLKRSQLQRNWGDTRQGIWSAIIQYALVKMESKRFHPKNWRPNILLFNRGKQSNLYLLNLAGALTRKSGFVTSIHLYKTGEITLGELKKDRIDIRDLIYAKGITVFRRSVVVKDLIQGRILAAQVNGLGGYKHNTVIIEWPEIEKEWFARKDKEIKNQFKLVRAFNDLNISTLLAKTATHEIHSEYKQIDVWWDPNQDNGSFMLLIAHLITLSRRKNPPNITIKTVVLEEKEKNIRVLLEELVRKSRIKADITVLYPNSADRQKLEIKYKRIVKTRKAREQALSYMGKMKAFFKTNNAAPKYDTPIKKADRNENDLLDKEEKQIREEISTQVEERDAYIIRENIQHIIANSSKPQIWSCWGIKYLQQKKNNNTSIR